MCEIYGAATQWSDRTQAAAACVTKVQWRRFFTWTWAFDELDDSWTARLVTGRFVAPKVIDILSRCGARMGDVQDAEKDLQERAVQEVVRGKGGQMAWALGAEGPG